VIPGRGAQTQSMGQSIHQRKNKGGRAIKNYEWEEKYREKMISAWHRRVKKKRLDPEYRTVLIGRKEGGRN